MGIRVERKLVVFESITGVGIEPEYTGITPGQLRAYMIGNPVPIDSEYSKEDILADIRSSGVWFLPDKTSEAVQDWIAQMLSDLL